MSKTFYVVRLPTVDEVGADGVVLSIEEKVEGTIEEARAVIASPSYKDGRYDILESTGVMTKETPPAPKPKITLVRSRKRTPKESA